MTLLILGVHGLNSVCVYFFCYTTMLHQFGNLLFVESLVSGPLRLSETMLARILIITSYGNGNIYVLVAFFHTR